MKLEMRSVVWYDSETGRNSMQSLQWGKSLPQDKDLCCSGPRFVSLNPTITAHTTLLIFSQSHSIYLHVKYANLRKEGGNIEQWKLTPNNASHMKYTAIQKVRSMIKGRKETQIYQCTHELSYGFTKVKLLNLPAPSNC